MRVNRVKKIMSEGKLAIGTYVSLADPQVVEIIGLAGFDAAFIDMEHTAFELPLVHFEKDHELLMVLLLDLLPGSCFSTFCLPTASMSKQKSVPITGGRLSTASAYASASSPVPVQTSSTLLSRVTSLTCAVNFRQARSRRILNRELRKSYRFAIAEKILRT